MVRDGQQGMLQTMESEFTTNWFQISKSNWEQLIPRTNPSMILEIGSYEGASACFVIEKLGNEKPIEIHCVDTWTGSIESKESDMDSVERRFDNNTAIAICKVSHDVKLVKHKGMSDQILSRLVADGYASGSGRPVRCRSGLSTLQGRRRNGFR